MSDTQMLLDKLTNAISFKFKEDMTSPNLTISRLKKGYYCSVVRFSGAFAKGKTVVCKAEDTTLEGALVKVAKQFLTTANVVRDPMQELGDMVK